MLDPNFFFLSFFKLWRDARLSRSPTEHLNSLQTFMLDHLGDMSPEQTEVLLFLRNDCQRSISQLANQGKRTGGLHKIPPLLQGMKTTEEAPPPQNGIEPYFCCEFTKLPKWPDPCVVCGEMCLGSNQKNCIGPLERFSRPKQIGKGRDNWHVGCIPANEKALFQSVYQYRQWFYIQCSMTPEQWDAKQNEVALSQGKKAAK